MKFRRTPAALAGKQIRGRRAFLKAAGSVAAAVVATGDTHAQSARPATQSPDRGLWITWYDLPESAREAYFDWLHKTYIPDLLRRPGFLWAAHYASAPKTTTGSLRQAGALRNTIDPAVPAGDRYILLFGAEHASVFGDPTPSALHAGMPVESRKMLAVRIGERMNVMTEAARVDSPALREYQGGMALAPCIQLGSFNIAWQDEEEMFAWYTQSRMPLMGRLPAGCIRTRKLASVSGWAKHAILYEFMSVEARNKYYLTLEDGHPEAKAWSDRLVPKLIHAPGSSNLASRIWPPVAG